jgi:hypothetical protein
MNNTATKEAPSSVDVINTLFKELDRVFTIYNTSTVVGFNKVLKHLLNYGVAMRTAGSVASIYHDYRQGHYSIDDAVSKVNNEVLT